MFMITNMTIASRLRNIRTLAVAVLFLAPVHLRAQEPASVTCADGSGSKGGKGACSHHGGIAKGTAPAAEAAVTCKDGTSSPHGGRGACSHHGGVRGTAANDNGVAPPVTERPTPSAPSAPAQHAGPSNSPAGAATAKCKDGSMSFSKHHSGTCSHHGGVAQWLDGSQ
jgi:hypothetical protein